MEKACLYLRVSTDKQVDGTSLDTQRQRAENVIRQHGAEVLSVFSDEGLSGKRYMSRPGLQAALAVVEAKQAKYFVVGDFDRMGRSLKVLLQIKERVEAAGAQMLFSDGFEVNATPAGNLSFSVLAAIKQYEVEQIRDRAIRGMRNRAENGIMPNRAHSPYGYHLWTNADCLQGKCQSDMVGRYEIDDSVADIVRDIFFRFAMLGESISAIANELRNKGILSQSAKPFSASSLGVILRNPIYVGRMEYGRRRVVVDASKEAAGNAYIYKTVKSTDGIILISCAAIIDEELWQKTQERLAQIGDGRNGGKGNRKYKLAGLLNCPVCGKTLSLTVGKHNYYRCRHAMAKRGYWEKTCSNSTYIPQNDVEDSVIAAILSGLTDESLDRGIAAYERQMYATDNTAAEIAQVDKQLAEISASEKATIRLQIAAEIAGRTTTTYDDILTELSTNRVTITAQRFCLSQRQTTPLSYNRSEKRAQLLSIARTVLTRANSQDINRALSTIVESVHPTADGQYDVRLRGSLVGKNGQQTRLCCLFNTTRVRVFI